MASDELPCPLAPETFAYFCLLNSLDYAELDETSLKSVQTKFCRKMELCCRNFAENENETPEEFLRLLAEVLPNLPASFTEVLLENNTKKLPNWVANLRVILQRIFFDKNLSGNNVVRTTAFSIASFLFIRFDFDWLRMDRKFLELLINLAKIEVNITLMDCENKQNQSISDILPCLVILQKTVEHILLNCDEQEKSWSDNNFSLDETLMNKLHQVVLEAVKLLMHYFVELEKLGSLKILDELVSLAIFRLLCTYLTEGFELLDENLVKLCLPIFTAILQKDIEDNKGDFLEYFTRLAQSLCEQNTWMDCVMKDTGLAKLLQTFEPTDMNKIEAKSILLNLIDKHTSK